MTLVVNHLMFVFRHNSKWPAASLLATLFLVLFLLSGCLAEPAKIQAYQGLTMGTTYTVKYVSSSEQDNFKSEIDSALKAVNQSMSTYIADSELSLINQAQIGHEQALSTELNYVLQLAQKISQESNGAFDITVGPLVNMWGFGPDGRVVKAPTDNEIQSLYDHVGYAKVNLHDGRLIKDTEIYLDLSAIAKGYGVDVIAELLEEKGIESYLVEIGGELRAKGLKPDGMEWRIAIETPTETFDRQIQKIIAVKDVGIATSGDYRNYFEENGVRFSHTIDPATGQPIKHKLASVTVLAQTCAEADAYATALMVMGAEDGYKFAQAHNIDAFFIVKNAQGFEEIMTPGFNNYLVR
ncbi:Thiamine biosynthesis lipoprotein ApbE [Oceanospirillum sp. MED92]|uniref:FAD:protein FMN transferase n=2 Tax=Neptuniibacter caesariensis TaxID=207954 RepID=A0A7U8GRU0_NEPCE|nr:Thiamine biosynthesis lipoprotein ApbE [Oceanospirillum sp. MED92] [Neptuniibacter caesariensis]